MLVTPYVPTQLQEIWVVVSLLGSGQTASKVPDFHIEAFQRVSARGSKGATAIRATRDNPRRVIRHRLRLRSDAEFAGPGRAKSEAKISYLLTYPQRSVC